jgi:hypothetical protein
MAEKSGLDGGCKVTDPGDRRRGSTTSSSVLNALYFVIVRTHNDLTYLIRRQQKCPFRTRSLNTFHFAADRNTSHPSKICNLADGNFFFSVPWRLYLPATQTQMVLRTKHSTSFAKFESNLPARCVLRSYAIYVLMAR